ncbi:MAG: SCO family protein [Acidobacteria bacterium]|nr:SCO family protein [Acidobacteriota bacterium]
MSRRLLMAIPVLLACAGEAWAQKEPPRDVSAADVRPAALVGVGLDQKLGERVPLDAVFRDETGRDVRLGEYFGARPVVLTLAYYECPMLCTQVLTDLVSALKVLSFDVGKEFTAVTVSFNPKERPELAAAKKEHYIARYGRPGAADGWHFLTGDQASIDRLTAAVGFRYSYDEQTKQYAHATGVMILTPDGRLARYFYGVDYSPRDVRLGLVEAASRRIGSPVDQILLFCYHYDPTKGKYTLLALNLVRLGGVATVVALGTFIVVMRRREKRARSGSG